MNKRLLIALLLPLLLGCCTQNQLILDPFYDGESLMILDEQDIAEFEALMSDIATPENEYKRKTKSRDFFDSQDILSSVQDTQPTLGICRSGEKEYYYHIERDPRGTYISDLNLGVTDYVISQEKFDQIQEFIRLHTPAPAEEEAPEDGEAEGEEKSAEESEDDAAPEEEAAEEESETEE